MTPEQIKAQEIVEKHRKILHYKSVFRKDAAIACFHFSTMLGMTANVLRLCDGHQRKTNY